MSKITISLSWGNSKLTDSILNWSIPPIKTCPGAGECKKYCYALKSYQRYPPVKKSWDSNWEASKQDDFPEKMIAKIKRKRKPIQVFRIHVSGDFYNQKYLEKWFQVARALPELQFYTYTKSGHLNFGAVPTNLEIIFSVESEFDRPKEINRESRVVDDREAELQENEEFCPYPHAECGKDCKKCWKSDKDIAFVKH